MANIGNKTNNYTIYNREGGKPKLVQETASYKRPSIENLTDTLKGSGIAGEVDVPTIGQYSSMQVEIAFKNATKEAQRMISQNVDLEVRWVTDTLDATQGKMAIRANKDIIRGIVKSVDLGTIESNATNDTTVSIEVLYFHSIVDGESMFEIDKLNNITKIHGQDITQDIRNAL